MADDETLIDVMSSSSAPESKSRSEKKRVQGKRHADGLSWARMKESHNLFAEQNVFPRESLTTQDLHNFAMCGDLVAQHYLRSLRAAIPPTPESKRPYVQSYFERLLMSHVRTMNEMLCELASSGRWCACEELWEQALRLTDTFRSLALKNPEPFQIKARHALLMPSVRGRNSKFTADAKAIADAIELSAETVGAGLEDNRKRIGALCAELVGTCVHDIVQARRLWMNFYVPYKHPVLWPTSLEIAPFLGKSQDELIALFVDERNPASKTEPENVAFHLRFFCLCSGGGVDRLHHLTLPDLSRQTASRWWKGAVERMVEAKFPSLLHQPAWVLELKRVSRGTESDMRKELKDYCVGKVRQFAPRSSNTRPGKARRRP